MNILLPMVGHSEYFSKDIFPFPYPTIEIQNKTIIELVIRNLRSISSEPKFIFLIRDSDASAHHLDRILNLATNTNAEIISLSNITKGALCTSLMAIEHIDNEEPLIIANSDQLFEIELNQYVKQFENSTAGVLTFNSVHPRWSYVKVDKNNMVIESAEKKPISRSAIAGFFYFKKGSIFVKYAKEVIKKDIQINNKFYISSVLNEIILDAGFVSSINIPNSKYHSLYTPQKIREYERYINN
tara:strand:+ start:1117 stop:1842 length:726 start_codon:yes stop_codon:yes gene_type:complete